MSRLVRRSARRKATTIPVFADRGSRIREVVHKTRFRRGPPMTSTGAMSHHMWLQQIRATHHVIGQTPTAPAEIAGPAAVVPTAPAPTNAPTVAAMPEVSCKHTHRADGRAARRALVCTSATPAQRAHQSSPRPFTARPPDPFHGPPPPFAFPRPPLSRAELPSRRWARMRTRRTRTRSAS